jgi:hypothetical protein
MTKTHGTLKETSIKSMAAILAVGVAATTTPIIMTPAIRAQATLIPVPTTPVLIPITQITVTTILGANIMARRIIFVSSLQPQRLYGMPIVTSLLLGLTMAAVRNHTVDNHLVSQLIFNCRVANLGYGETVIVILYAVDSPGGNWYKVDTLPSGTTGGGISNYHVRKDLGKAYSYMIVLEIDKVHFTIGSDPFKIKKSINHYNEDSDSWTEWSGDSDSSDFSSYDPSSYDSNGSNSGDYNTNTYDSSTSTYSYSSHGNDDSVSNPDDSKRYLRVTSPKLYTVWDADSYQTVTWTYDGSCK